MRVVEDPLNRETIEAITRLIVDRFQPEQVILFGSCARGETDENSDLDLMVVLRPGEEPPHGEATQSTQPYPNSFVLPVDLLISSLRRRSPPTVPTPTPCSAACWKTPKFSMTDERPELPWFAKANADLEMSCGPGCAQPGTCASCRPYLRARRSSRQTESSIRSCRSDRQGPFLTSSSCAAAAASLVCSRDLKTSDSWDKGPCPPHIRKPNARPSSSSPAPPPPAKPALHLSWPNTRLSKSSPPTPARSTAASTSAPPNQHSPNENAYPTTLVDIIDPDEIFNAHRFAHMARDAIADIRSRGARFPSSSAAPASTSRPCSRAPRSAPPRPILTCAAA